MVLVGDRAGLLPIPSTPGLHHYPGGTGKTPGATPIAHLAERL